MAAFTFEETNRIYLGEVTLQSAAPSNPPAAGAGVVENLYYFDIGPTAVAERRQVRFKVCEALITFPGDRTQCDVIFHYSRVNPAPLDRSVVTDSDADTWGSPGGQLAFKTATVAAGNILEFAPRGARLIYLQYQNLDGSSGTPTAKIYGLMSGVGGGW